MRIDRISMELSILYFKGSHIEIFANSADLDEMLNYAAFHLGHHSFPKYLLFYMILYVPST